MDLHLEMYGTPVSGLGVHRTTADADSVADAMKQGEKTVLQQEAKAAHLYSAPSGNTGFGNGELVAVYTRRSGFVEMKEDVRPWWNGLTTDVQRELIENAHDPLPSSAAPAAAATLNNGSMGYFVTIDDGEGRHLLRPDVATFVETMGVPHDPGARQD